MTGGKYEKFKDTDGEYEGDDREEAEFEVSLLPVPDIWSSGGQSTPRDSPSLRARSVLRQDCYEIKCVLLA